MRISIQEGVEAIKNGEIIAYPTEGVYGFGVDANNESAVEALLDLKQRDPKKGFIVITDDLDKLSSWIKPLTQNEIQKILNLNEYGYRNTWLIEVNSAVPKWLIGEFTTLAVRVSNHAVVQGLCSQLRFPIVSTSANISGENCLDTSAAIEREFCAKITGLVEGEVGILDRPSKIISLNNNKIIRE